MPQEATKQMMIEYLIKYNYSIEKLRTKTYQEISAIYLNHNPKKGEK